MRRPAHKDAATIASGREALVELAELASSLRHATLLTDDGFEVTSTPARSHDGRMASMASSIQALSDAVAGELAIGSCQYVIIASERGHVIQLRIPGHALVLSALFDHDETLGKALATSRVAADKLASALSAA